MFMRSLRHISKNTLLLCSLKSLASTEIKQQNGVKVWYFVTKVKSSGLKW